MFFLDRDVFNMPIFSGAEPNNMADRVMHVSGVGSNGANSMSRKKKDVQTIARESCPLSLVMFIISHKH